MAQKVLIIKSMGEEIISKPFDFEAMCIIDDSRQSQRGMLRAGMEAVYYLFEGTKATNTVIDNLDIAEKAEFVQTVNRWYIDELTQAQKNAKCPQTERAED